MGAGFSKTRSILIWASKRRRRYQKGIFTHNNAENHSQSLHEKTDPYKRLLRAQLARTDYVWPINDEEETRHVLLHNLWKDIFKGNTFTSVEKLEQGARVLYIGRDKFWALDMARTYPASEIHCIDYLNYNGTIFRSKIVPSNCILHEIEPGFPLPWPNDYFDLAASRGLLFVLTEADWDRHMNEMVRVTKSGGYVEQCCSSLHVFNSGPVVELIITSATYALRANGHNPECFKAVHTFMTKCPKLNHIISQKLAIPIGPWHDDPEWREHGRVMLQQFMISCWSGIKYFSQVLGVPRAKLGQDFETMQEEFRRYRSYQNIYVEVCRKF